MRPLRYYSDFLYTINAATYPSTVIDNAPIVLFGGGAGAYVGFPLWLGVYPIPTEINSLVLEWTVQTLPIGATYLEMVPFSMKGLINTGSLVPGYYNEDATNLGTAVNEQNRYTFDYLDQVASLAGVRNYYLQKTATDGVVGSTHFINIGSPYIGFYFLSDGAGGTGSQTIYAHLSHR